MKTKNKPALARQGFEDVLKMARWYQMLRDLDGSILRCASGICVTFHASPFAHECAPTLDEAMEKAINSREEEIKWRRRNLRQDKR